MIMDKFNVGTIYRASSLYGGSIKYEVVERTDNQVAMKESWIAEDTGEEVYNISKFDIEIDDGIERIQIWQYRDYKGYIYAND